MAPTPEETVRRFVEVYDRAMNHGDVELVYELYSPDFACRNPHYSASGYEEISQSVERQRRAFPDLRFEIDFIFATDEGLTICWTMRGTHEHELYGIPPSGRFLEMQGISVHRLVDGRSMGGYSAADVKEQMAEAHEAVSNEKEAV